MKRRPRLSQLVYSSIVFKCCSWNVRGVEKKITCSHMRICNSKQSIIWREKTAPWLCVHEHVNVCFLSPCRYSDSFISGVRESSEISSLFPLCLHRLHVLRARRTCLKCVFSSLQVSRPSWQIPAWGGTPLWELPSGWLLRYSKNWPINAPAASSLSTTLAWSRSQWATVNNHQRDNTVRYNVHGKKKR